MFPIEYLETIYFIFWKANKKNAYLKPSRPVGRYQDRIASSMVFSQSALINK